MKKEIHNTQAVWNSAPLTTSVYKSLSSDIEADVAIIGAGITGLSTAYNLKKGGKKVVVLESGEVGMGTTGSSTGNLYVPTAKFKTILSKHSKEVLDTVISSRNAAMAFIENRVNEFGIECGFTNVPWYYFTNNEDNVSEIDKEYEAMVAGGLNPEKTLPPLFPFSAKSIVHVDGQAQFNPLQYVKKLAAELSDENCLIFEKTKVTDIKDGTPCRIETTGGTVTAKKVVQATHTPKGIYAVHAVMEVYREYALAARLNQPMAQDAIYWLLDGEKKYSIRTYSVGESSWLVALDESQKIGHKENTLENFVKLDEFIRSVFDVAEVEFFWAAQNYSPADYLPYIGTSPMQNNVYIATGFSADGLVWGTAASIVISDLILGNENRWAKIFAPTRFTPAASAEKAIKENIHVAKHLLKDHVKKAEKDITGLSNGESKIVDHDGKKAAVYRDENGQLHVVSAICTHMGCVVHWNNAEKSWDCPCHGTRFTVDGEVLEGPAFKNLHNYNQSLNPE